MSTDIEEKFGIKVNSSVSIIVPVLNEEQYIALSLESLLNQSYFNIIEILIIDGLSTDRTLEIVNNYKDLDNRIKVFANEKRNQSAALNLGILQSKGEIIARADAHAVYSENYIKNAVDKLLELRKYGVVNVGGAMTPLKTDNRNNSGGYIKNCIDLLHKSIFGIGAAKFRREGYDGFVDSIWNGVFWKSIFNEIGLYNENAFRSEDNDMSQRIIDNGYKIYQSNSIVSYYIPRASISKLLKQYFLNGTAIGYSLIHNFKVVRFRHFAPVIFVSVLVVFLMSMFTSGMVMKIALLVISIYFIANLFESFRLGVKFGILYFPMMIILFFLLHLIYGVGTFNGIFQATTKK